MVYRFEKILLIILIVVFGLLPLIAFPLITGMSEVQVEGAENKDQAFLISSAFEQVAAVATAFVVKPVYTIVALIIAIVLWKKTDLELKALKWAMLFFLHRRKFLCG